MAKEEKPKRWMKALMAAVLWHRKPDIPGGPTLENRDESENQVKESKKWAQS